MNTATAERQHATSQATTGAKFLESKLGQRFFTDAINRMVPVEIRACAILKAIQALPEEKRWSALRREWLKARAELNQLSAGRIEHTSETFRVSLAVIDAVIDNRLDMNQAYKSLYSEITQPTDGTSQELDEFIEHYAQDYSQRMNETQLAQADTAI